MSEKRRFAELSDEELMKKRQATVPKNTQKNNKMAAELLRTYLKEKNEPTNFEEFNEEKLAKALCHFYMEARTKSGDLYKAKSFENFRYSLNRHLKSPPFDRKFDIILGKDFTEANEFYKSALTEIKQSGKGSIEHYSMITNSDLRKLYNSIFLTPETPSGLLNRVQMNIRLYFCRRANENMDKMTKDSFVVRTYEDGSRYIVKQLDELTKNHRGNDNELISGHMPEDKENERYCPVQTYLKYTSKLSPECTRLWQYPKESFFETDKYWYQNRPIGRDTLSKFMRNLSNNAELSQCYTNHCIRVTGTSLLSQSNFAPAQIMSITGHKSVSSLSVYQKVTNKEKQAMGTVIKNCTVPSVKQLALPAPSELLALDTPAYQFALPAPPQLNALPAPDLELTPPVPLECNAFQAHDQQVALPASLPQAPMSTYLQGLKMSDLFSDFDAIDVQQPQNRVLSMSVNHPKAPIFGGNCTLSNVTVNINYAKP